MSVTELHRSTSSPEVVYLIILSAHVQRELRYSVSSNSVFVCLSFCYHASEGIARFWSTDLVSHESTVCMWVHTQAFLKRWPREYQSPSDNDIHHTSGSLFTCKIGMEFVPAFRRRSESNQVNRPDPQYISKVYILQS